MQVMASAIKTPRRQKLTLVVEPERCKGCGYCVAFCPKGVLALSEVQFNAKGYYFAEMRDADQCVGCGLCAMYCPDFAIYLLDDSGECESACEVTPERREDQ